MDSTEQWRLRVVLPLIRGRLLDVGCGYNNLVRLYGGGIGVDVYPWPGIDILIEDAAQLPFANRQFDTVTFIACLNHIPNRHEALREARRVIKDDGRLIVTMINPLTGILAHILFGHDEKVRGGLETGERKGMWSHEVHALLTRSGFEVIGMKRFEFGLNQVYAARPAFHTLIDEYL